jgi:hypothetical protein
MPAHRLPSDTAQAGWVIDTPATATPIGISKVSIHKLILVGVGETNTVADPRKAGLRKTLVVTAFTASATRIVTFASAINVAGNTIITFSALRHTAFLESVPSGSTYRWQVIAVDGAALS